VVPWHTVVPVLGAMLTEGDNTGFTIITNALLTTVGVVTHVADEVSAQVICWLDESDDEV
jgi:hypothetical protein